MNGNRGGGIVAKQKFAIGGAQRDVHTEEQGSPAPHTQNDQQVMLTSQFQTLLGAVRDALTPVWFSGPIQSPQAMVLRDAPIVIQTLHNPTSAAIVVSLVIDAGQPPVFSTSLAAGATLTDLNLRFPRLSGFVSAGYVTFGGTLPAT